MNTGTGPFCTDTQMSGGGYWWKSASANTILHLSGSCSAIRGFWCRGGAASSSSTVNIAALPGLNALGAGAWRRRMEHRPVRERQQFFQ